MLTKKQLNKLTSLNEDICDLTLEITDAEVCEALVNVNRILLDIFDKKITKKEEL